MTTLIRLAFFAALSAVPGLAQTGTVTFYTPGNTFRSATAGFLPRSRQPFTGWIFDGSQRLVHVRPGRFMAFDLRPGEHSFTVPWHETQPGKNTLVIDVEADHKYCVALYATVTNFELVPYERFHSHMEEVPCRQALQESPYLGPIELKRVDPAVRNELDPSTIFPGTSPSQP